jgi:hypothetical protein
MGASPGSNHSATFHDWPQYSCPLIAQPIKASSHKSLGINNRSEIPPLDAVVALGLRRDTLLFGFPPIGISGMPPEERSKWPILVRQIGKRFWHQRKIGDVRVTVDVA